MEATACVFVVFAGELTRNETPFTGAVMEMTGGKSATTRKDAWPTRGSRSTVHREVISNSIRPCEDRLAEGVRADVIIRHHFAQRTQIRSGINSECRIKEILPLVVTVKTPLDGAVHDHQIDLPTPTSACFGSSGSAVA